MLQSAVFLLVCILLQGSLSCFFFFFNDTATTEIYTLSLHDALPICVLVAFSFSKKGKLPQRIVLAIFFFLPWMVRFFSGGYADRKSTRLNSSHGYISYAVFCLKKKTKKKSTYDLSITPTLPSVCVAS